MARKKASKKPAKKMKVSGLTIKLVSGVGADPVMPTAHRNASKNPNRIRWWNKTDRGHTVTFTEWPFAEAPESIQVDSNKKTKWYRIYPGTLDGAYDYTITPTINPPSGPPDEPAIVVQD
ncbi:MAG TPA: hypothetical protein VFP10_00215 [Candidatus Eisenbacteria bacterium]|nr:hypothetical protein [Candidatus Eisenbacteria bacterium]